jgi:hypothetical protein
LAARRAAQVVAGGPAAAFEAMEPRLLMSGTVGLDLPNGRIASGALTSSAIVSGRWDDVDIVHVVTADGPHGAGSSSPMMSPPSFPLALLSQ